MNGIRRLKTNFSKPYDWEDTKDVENAVDTALSITEGRKAKQNKLTRKWLLKFLNSIFISEEQLEWRLYPSTNPIYFEENILGL